MASLRGLRHGFRALRHRNYRIYYAGQFVSLVGTWMQSVAQAWLVLQLTGSPVALGAVAALQTLPVFFLSPIGGAMCDRLPKRNLLLTTQTTQMLLALILGALVSTHLVQIWQVYVLATLLGISNGFDMPARQSFIIEMVGREDLMNGISLQAMQINAAFVVGPALAGLSIAAIGVAGSFFANAASFLAVICSLLLMRVEQFYAVPRVARVSVGASLRQGAQFIWRTPAVLVIVILVATMGLFNSNINVLMPIIAKDILRVGPQGYGLLMAMMGVGAVIAAVIAAFAQRSRWKYIVGGAIAFFLVQVCISLSRSFPLSLALMALCGFSMIVFFTSANTGIQRRLPDQLRGRVMGVYMAVNIGTAPLGNLSIGWLASRFGASAAMAMGALVALAALTVVGGWLVFHHRASELVLAHTPAFSDSVLLTGLADAGD